MAIDLPPALPPQLVASASYQDTAVSRASYIQGQIDTTEIRVVGNRYLSTEAVERIIKQSQLPSDAIIGLANEYYKAGHLLVKLRYFRVDNRITILVNQYTLSDVRGNPQAKNHFEGLIGDSDLTAAEFDRARVLADLQARRAGIDYSYSYQEQPDTKQVVLTLQAHALKDNDATDYIAELNNSGSRYIGRYFGLAGIKHRSAIGSEYAFSYQSAFTELGESADGDSLHQFSASADHPFRYGLYGIELAYSNYERRPPSEDSANNNCALLGLLCLGASANTPENTRLEADIIQLALRGQQIVYSSPKQRFTVSERIEYVNSVIEQSEDGSKLLDERYSAAAIDLKYTRATAPTRSSLSIGLNSRFGLSGGGTLDSYDSFDQRYQEQNPNAGASPDLAPAARSAHFVALQPSISYQLPLPYDLAFSTQLKSQFANKQLPEQEQFVLGGISSLSAYLPGALIGDEGYYWKLALSQTWTWRDINLQPSVFIEHGGAWFNDTRSSAGNAQTISDIGVALNINFSSVLQSQLVTAYALADDVQDQENLKRLEADIYWRIRLEL